MFSECHALTTLNVSSFNTQNVTNMTSMFLSCGNLSELDVTGFNTEKVTSMCQMFMYCGSLSSLDLSSFNTSNVTDMCRMFYNDYSMEKIYAGSGWTTANVKHKTAEHDGMQAHYCDDAMFYNAWHLHIWGYVANYTGSATGLFTGADIQYACINSTSAPGGYFTRKS